MCVCRLYNRLSHIVKKTVLLWKQISCHLWKWDFDCINLTIKFRYWSCSDACHNRKNLVAVLKKLKQKVQYCPQNRSDQNHKGGIIQFHWSKPMTADRNHASHWYDISLVQIGTWTSMKSHCLKPITTPLDGTLHIWDDLSGYCFSSRLHLAAESEMPVTFNQCQGCKECTMN